MTTGETTGGAGSPAPTVLVVQHEASTGAGRFGDWLAAAGVRLEVLHPYAGDDLPVVAAGLDGLLVLGGAMGPADDASCAWLPGARRLLASAVALAVPTFGICLGAELLALACGGEVRRGPAGPELGVLPMVAEPACADDPVFAAMPASARVVQWHWEEISALPAGAVHLASSPAYPVQAFRLGPAAWGVQGHPEVTTEITAAWAREDSPLLLAAGRSPEDLVAEVAAAQDALGSVWQPVAAGFAARVHEAAAHRR